MNDLQRRVAHLEQLPVVPRRRVWCLERLTEAERRDLARIQDKAQAFGSLAALTDAEVCRAADMAERAGVLIDP